MSKGKTCASQARPQEAEARGVQEAISWVEELRLDGVCIENDSALVVNVVYGLVKYYLKVGHIIEFCQQKLRIGLILLFVMLKSKSFMSLTFWLEYHVWSITIIFLSLLQIYCWRRCTLIIRFNDIISCFKKKFKKK